jgi:hypothetical protein
MTLAVAGSGFAEPSSHLSASPPSDLLHWGQIDERGEDSSMAFFEQETEEDIIASVRLRQKMRRPIGTLLMFLGVCAFAVTVQIVHAYTDTLTEAVEFIQDRTPGDGAEKELGSIFTATHEAAYFSGKSLAHGTLLGLLMFSFGLAYAVGGRREDDLLLRCFEMARTRTDGPSGA